MGSITDIRITGFGGQGVILMGYIIGKATSIYDIKFATLTQSFGPEARGSACSAQIVVSEDKVLYPYVHDADILVAMSQEGYDKHFDKVKPGGTILYEKDLVKLENLNEKATYFGITSTRIAEELGRALVQNIVMLGFFAAVTKLASFESMEKSVLSAVPKGTEELNSKAFRSGYDYFK